MPRAFEIGSFLLDAESGVLTQDGKPTALGPRAVAVLTVLVERANSYVPKAQIIDVAWPGAVVEEGNLPVQIAAIRRVLAQSGGEQWIETLSRRGYRFVGPVRKLTNDRPSASSAPRSNLPSALTSFIGRERELVEVKRLLPLKRLVTIQGAGGIGKTRLALQVAAEAVDAYRDGVWLAELGSIRDPALVSTTVAQLLGLAEKSSTSSTEGLCAYLKSRQLLLVLDNCEHLIDACARLAEAALRAAKELTIIATSREPLRLAGEQSYVLQPLSLPEPGSHDTIRNSEAVQLFVERVQQQLPGFDLTPQRAPAVAEICIHLDGIPLALELAAARTRSVSVEQINARLTDRFRLLTDGSRAALPRQHTLRAALDWSYDLLAEDERVVLRRLSIFPGSFTVEAASAVASDDKIDEHAVIDLLAQLVSRSLVMADTNGRSTRYRMLETTRAYAFEKLTEADETETEQRRHAQHIGDMFAPAPEDWLRMSDLEWDAAYAPELANVRAAIEWALGGDHDAAIGIKLAADSGVLWSALGLYREGAQWLEAAIARMVADTPEPDQARLWVWLGRLVDKSPTQARPAFERAVELYRRVGDPLGLGISLARLGRVLAYIGRYTESATNLDEARALLEGSGPSRLRALCFANLAFLATFTGDLDAACRHYDQALALDRKAGAEFGALATIGNLANVRWALGDLDAAARSLRELVTLLRSSSAKTERFMGFALMNLAGALTERGDIPEALVAAKEGLPLVRKDGPAWMFFDHLALRAALAGKLRNAAHLVGYSDSRWAAEAAKRQPVEARVQARLRALLRERLPDGELGQLLAEGAKLSEDEASPLALED